MSKLLAIELNFWRRSARVSRLDHIAILRIIEINIVKEDINEKIRKRQLQMVWSRGNNPVRKNSQYIKQDSHRQTQTQEFMDTRI